MRVDQVARLVLLGQLHKFVRYYDPDGKRLDPYFFIHIDLFTVQELFYVRVEDVEINRTGSRSLSQLVCVGKRVFQNFHDWQYTSCTALYSFNGLTTGSDLGNIEGHATADRGKLHGRIYCISYPI